MSDCIFCAIVARTAPAQIIDEDEHTLSFMDINPATDGHVLVVPKRHVENIHDIDPDDISAVVRSAKRLADRMRTVLEPAGINLIQANGAAAFQTVFHFHMHVVPRYAGDPIKMPWIPRPGDPSTIADIAQRLRRE
jgi:histidine triad (HIT) family protein